MNVRLAGSIILLALVAAGCQSTGGTSSSSGGETADDIRVKEGPDSPAETNVKLGSEYMRQGQNDVALLKFRRALAQDSKLPSAHYGIALLYERLNNDGLAETHYKEAISLDPLYSDAQNAYGVFLCKRKQYSDADLHFNQALKNPLYATPALAYSNAGFCAFEDGKIEKAEQYLRKSLQLDKRNFAALFQMARVMFDKGDFLNTRAYLSRYHSVVKPSPQSLYLGIKTEEKLGDKNAVSSYRLLLKSEYPDSEENMALEKSP